MKIKRKSPLTLIEVCLAFGIIAVCFYIVFSNFTTTSKMIAKTEAATVKVQQKQYLMQRLTSVLEKTEKKSLQVEEKREGSETISFLSLVFENGLDRELTFSGIRRGEIEVIDHALNLTIVSKEGDEKRNERLLDGVIEANWDLETPSVAKLDLVLEDNEELSFAFILPRTQEDKIIIEEVK